MTVHADSVVIDRMDMYYMAGKWKLTGDGKFRQIEGNDYGLTIIWLGSTGQPYTSFKYVLLLYEIA